MSIQIENNAGREDIKVLIVDTDPAHITDLEKKLLVCGYRCAHTDSVEKAIFLVKTLPSINFIITDTQLADGNAAKLLKFIVGNSRFSCIPVLICSQSADEEMVLRYIKGGARDFMAKPVNSEVLSAKIKKIVRKTQTPILIVDDDRLIRELLANSIEREGFKAIEAANGKEALALMEANNIKAIITDIEMPEMDGAELLEKAKELYPEVPVILITGKSQRFIEDDISLSRADGFIYKPFKNVEILNTIYSFNIRPS